MIGLYVMTGIVIAILIIVLLSFLGPEESEKGFWKTISIIRKMMDDFSYFLFNLFAFLGIGKAISDLVHNMNMDHLSENIMAIFGIVLLAYILLFSICRFIRDH